MATTLLTCLLAAPVAPILLLSYECQAVENYAAPRYELMIAAGMIRSRWVSRVDGSVAQETSKVLSASELADLRSSISRLPAPFSNYAPERTALPTLAVLKLVAAAKVWNVGHSHRIRVGTTFSPCCNGLNGSIGPRSFALYARGSVLEIDMFQHLISG